MKIGTFFLRRAFGFALLLSLCGAFLFEDLN